MEKQFNLTLTNRLTLALLLIGGLLLIMFGLKDLDNLAKTLAIGKDARMVGFLLLMAGGLYGLYRIAKKCW